MEGSVWVLQFIVQASVKSQKGLSKRLFTRFGYGLTKTFKERMRLCDGIIGAVQVVLRTAVDM